jgi:hypothetical protein
MKREIINLRNEIANMVGKYKDNEGVNDQSAFRDILTDIMHLTNDRGINFEEVMTGAREVLAQEDEREPRKQKAFRLNVKMVIDAEADVEYNEVLENMDYEFKSRTEGATIVETEITDW